MTSDYFQEDHPIRMWVILAADERGNLIAKDEKADTIEAAIHKYESTASRKPIAYAQLGTSGTPLRLLPLD